MAEEPGPSEPMASRDVTMTMTRDQANSRDVTAPMDTDESVVCRNSISSSSVIHLHPLVAMNIADTATRCKITNRNFDYALGVLLGEQTGRDIEITSSFDVCYDVVDDSWILNREYLESRLDQVSQIKSMGQGESSWTESANAGNDIVGWYALGDAPSQRHLNMHSQVSQVMESPVLLMFDYTQEKELAIRTFESISDISNKQSRTAFVELQYTVKTTEGERIGVDHAAGASVSGFSAVADALGSHQSAIAMLNGRVNVICDYIREVKEGKRQSNPAVMRSIASLVSSLPQPEQHSASFKNKTNRDMVDALMIASLATLTKGIMTHDEVTAKASVIHSSAVGSKKIKGLEIMSTFARTLPI